MKMNQLILGIFCGSLLLAGCKPQKDKEITLPAPETASFTFEPFPDPADPTNQNLFLFKNTTPGGFVSSWDYDKGSANTRQNVDTAFFAYEGSYNVKLTTASKGGITTATKTVTVAKTSPYAAEFTIKDNGGYNYTATVVTPNPKKFKWDLPTGDTSLLPSVTFYWPFDSVNVSLTLTASNNSVSTRNKTLVVASDDPNNPWLTDPMMLALTGGKGNLKGKTWLFYKHNGVGPANSTETAYYTNKDVGLQKGAEWLSGAIDNEYNFKFNNFIYTPKKTNVTMNWSTANQIFKVNPPRADYSDLAMQDPKIVVAPFYLKKVENPLTSGYVLNVTRGSYFAYGENRSSYEVMRFSANSDTLIVRQLFNETAPADQTLNPNARYFTFVAKK